MHTVAEQRGMYRYRVSEERNIKNWPKPTNTDSTAAAKREQLG